MIYIVSDHRNIVDLLSRCQSIVSC